MGEDDPFYYFGDLYERFGSESSENEASDTMPAAWDEDSSATHAGDDDVTVLFNRIFVIHNLAGETASHLAKLDGTAASRALVLRVAADVEEGITSLHAHIEQLYEMVQAMHSSNPIHAGKWRNIVQKVVKKSSKVFVA